MRLIDAESPQNGIYVSDLVIEEMKKNNGNEDRA